MPHVFRVSPDWGHELAAKAPALFRDRNLSKRLVHDNDALVKAGRFSTSAGEQVLPRPPATERQRYSEHGVAAGGVLFDVTEVCVANINTLSAALLVGDAAALNFANAFSPGGGYRRGSNAQEEDLCRLLPQLFHSLRACAYPIGPDEVLLTRGLAAVRDPGTYSLCPSMGLVNILTAAMPSRGSGLWPGSEDWYATVRVRMRTVLQAAKASGLPHLVLGAWGCGAFGNPPYPVANLFREQLCSPEFRGAFGKVVFAVIDPKGAQDGNFDTFEKTISEMDETQAEAAPSVAATGTASVTTMAMGKAAGAAKASGVAAGVVVGRWRRSGELAACSGSASSHSPARIEEAPKVGAPGGECAAAASDAEAKAAAGDGGGLRGERREPAAVDQ